MTADPAAGGGLDAIARVRAVLLDAIATGLFPAAVAEVGDRTGRLWREAFGRLSFDPDAKGTDTETVFDLASLTKPMATTAVIMHLAASRRLDLDEVVSGCFEDWRQEDRAAVTVRDLLEHASGLPARLLDEPPASRREFEHDIATITLAYPPRSASLYSDLGFLLLGFLAEDRGAAKLSTQFDALRLLMGAALQKADAAVPEPGVLQFLPPLALRDNIAPTRALPEDIRRGARLVGEVHDNYAAALGGVAGHAGLFGNIAGVSGVARVALRGALEATGLFPPFTYPWIMKTVRKSAVPGSSRALGWDTMLPTSSCGAGMSFAAFGHVGFTGTSLWIDPILDRYFVLLTNRACNGGSPDQMRAVRRAFHDAALGVE